MSRLPRLLLCLLLLSGACDAVAQARLVYGFSVGTAAKFGIVQQPRMRYHPWGEVNIGGSVGISGPSPLSMTCRLNTQLSIDYLIIHTGKNEGYIVETRGFLLNPEVCIPLRNRYGESKIDLLAGIGMDILAEQSLTQRNFTGFFGGSYLEEMNDSIRAARRNFVPYATAGIAFKLHRRGTLIIRLRQDAQNDYYKGSVITLPTSSGDRTVNLSCQATRLLIGCQVTLGKLPELY